MSILFNESHEWVKVENQIATVGISDFAQAELGDITYVDLPSVGTVVAKGKDFASIESVKAASDIYSPVEGEIVEVNAELENAPETINSDPYNAGWIAKIKLSAEPTGLMTEDEYKAKNA